MLHAVIFDFDGIIADTEPLHYRAFQQVLEPLGLGYTWERYVDLYMGFDDRDAFIEAFRAGSKPLDQVGLEQLISRKAAAFLEIVAGGVSAYPGVVELIRALAAKIPVALCSGALPSDIEPILASLGLQDAFAIRVTAVDVSASKPDPASYALALSRLREQHPKKEISASRCLAIEDTPAGIASATGAGLPVLAVTNSYPASHLGKAVKIVDSLENVTPDDLMHLF